MVVKYSGIAGKRGYAPKKIVLHNDEGSQNANSAFYKRWLETHDPEKGYAHYYVADDGTYQAEKDENCAWHCGNTVGNRDYIGIEICQSKGNEATFKANEQRAFKLAYDLCKKYGIAITVDNFPLHKELSATSCPRRSLELHGKSSVALKKYFVEQVLKFGEATAKPVAKPTPPKPVTPKSKPTTTIPKGFKAEKATFTVTTNDGIQVRKGSHGLTAPKAGILKKGQSINYDSWASKDGYIWVHYVGNSGDHLFLPVRPVGKSAWGTFK